MMKMCLSTRPTVKYFTTLLLEYFLTYSMEQSPSWKTNWFAASQEIPRVLWNPKVPHRTHKRPPRIPILSQPNLVLTPTSHFLKIYPNIILPSTPGSPKRSLSLRFPHHNPVRTSPFPRTIVRLLLNIILLHFAQKLLNQKLILSM
jgi:hypothetical protein